MDKIRIEGLEKTYASKGGRITALAQIDLTIRQNEFITLVGPSGCGKSTLLKLIGVLIRPSQVSCSMTVWRSRGRRAT